MSANQAKWQVYMDDAKKLIVCVFQDWHSPLDKSLSRVTPPTPTPPPPYLTPSLSPTAHLLSFSHSRLSPGIFRSRKGVFIVYSYTNIQLYKYRHISLRVHWL